MTREQIKQVFSGSESLKSTERRGECFVDFGKIWREPKEPTLRKVSKAWVAVSILAILAVVLAAATIIII